VADIFCEPQKNLIEIPPYYIDTLVIVFILLKSSLAEILLTSIGMGVAGNNIPLWEESRL
jgi:hypothetical protein